MKFKNQLCSREQGEKLQKLRLRAKSLHIHITKTVFEIDESASNLPEFDIIIQNIPVPHPCYNNDQHYNAYSGDELGVLLSQIPEHEFAIYCRKNSFDGRLYPQGISKLTLGKNGDNEARVKADLLILAIEKGIVKPDNLKL